MHPFSEAVSTAAGKKEVKEKPQPMALKSEPTQKVQIRMEEQMSGIRFGNLPEQILIRMPRI